MSFATDSIRIDLNGLMCEVDEVQGIVTLARDVVNREAGRNQELASAWTALGGAAKLLQSIRDEMEVMHNRVGAAPEKQP